MRKESFELRVWGDSRGERNGTRRGKLGETMYFQGRPSKYHPTFYSVCHIFLLSSFFFPLFNMLFSL